MRPHALTALIREMVTLDGDKRPQLGRVHTRLLNLKFGTPAHAQGYTSGSTRYLRAPLCCVWPVNDHVEEKRGHISDEDSNQSLDSNGSRVLDDEIDPIPIGDVAVGDLHNGCYDRLFLCLQFTRPPTRSGAIDDFYVSMSSHADMRYDRRDSVSQYMYVTGQEPGEVRLRFQRHADEHNVIICAIWESKSSSGPSAETCVPCH